MKKIPNPKKINQTIKSLYIHIPFCHHLCHYCDFPKMLYDEKMAFSYLKQLFLELDSYCIDKVETIYIGGGTPSSLNISLLTRLLEKVQPLLVDNGEFSIELNVENLNDLKLAVMKKYGVTRLSIGVQSTDDQILKSLNRQHNYLDVINAVAAARKFGFDNINLDLIYGVPSQSESILIKDINRLLKLNPEHLSIYSLTIHPGTIFFLKGVKEQDEDNSRKHYDIILEELRHNGYVRYEVSNFAKPGFCSRHNQTYWRNEQYYGIGLGASGFVNGIRYDNTRSMNDYLNSKYRKIEEIISIEEDEKYFWMLNLRLEDGFLLKEYEKRYGNELLQMRLNSLQQALQDGLIIKSNEKIHLSDDGMMILDRILLTII